MAYSEDLCIRLVNKVSAVMSRRLAAAHFAVSWSSAVRFANRFEETGSVAVTSHPPRRRRLIPMERIFSAGLKRRRT